jgi:hypothetical protein
VTREQDFRGPKDLVSRGADSQHKSWEGCWRNATARIEYQPGSQGRFLYWEAAGVLKASEAHNLTEVEAPGVRPAETFSSSLLPTLHRNQGFLFFHIFSQIGDETSFFVAGVATKFIFHLYFTIIFIQNIDFSSKCAIFIQLWQMFEGNENNNGNLFFEKFVNIVLDFHFGEKGITIWQQIAFKKKG